MLAVLMPLISPGRRPQRLVVLLALAILFALWLAAAASVGDAAPPDGTLFAPFRWLSQSRSA
jgi:hypothetical protein